MLTGALRAAAVLGATAMALPACGPIEYIATVPLDANGAIAAAKLANGEKYAPYEMTAAEEYVKKSRMLAGYARFHSSVQFGAKAADNARKAKRIALEKAAMPEERSSEKAPAATENAPHAEAAPATSAPPAMTVVPSTSPPPAAAQTTTVTIIHTDQAPAPTPVQPIEPGQK